MTNILRGYLLCVNVITLVFVNVLGSVRHDISLLCQRLGDDGESDSSPICLSARATIIVRTYWSQITNIQYSGHLFWRLLESGLGLGFIYPVNISSQVSLLACRSWTCWNVIRCLKSCSRKMSIDSSWISPSPELCRCSPHQQPILDMRQNNPWDLRIEVLQL